MPDLTNRVKQSPMNMRSRVGEVTMGSRMCGNGKGVLTERGGVSGAEHVAQTELQNQIYLISG